MNLHLSGQIAVVVGGASGIGRAIAVAFAREQAGVAILDKSPTVIETAAAIESASGVRAVPLVVDVTDYAAMQQAAADVLTAHGRCDHVVYAAGAGSGKYGFPFWNLEPADWSRCVAVTLLGAVHAAHAFAPLLVQGSGPQRGCEAPALRTGEEVRESEDEVSQRYNMGAAAEQTILFISSVAGQIGSQTDPPYSAAKAGLINFAQCAAKDLAPYGVRVNTICPGMIRTPLNESVWKAWYDRQPPEERLSYDVWAEEKIRRGTPLARWQEPEDVAALALFLASAQAKNITGQTMNVDGGQVMHW